MENKIIMDDSWEDELKEESEKKLSVMITKNPKPTKCFLCGGTRKSGKPFLINREYECPNCGKKIMFKCVNKSGRKVTYADIQEIIK